MTPLSSAYSQTKKLPLANFLRVAFQYQRQIQEKRRMPAWDCKKAITVSVGEKKMQTEMQTQGENTDAQLDNMLYLR